MYMVILIQDRSKTGIKIARIFNCIADDGRIHLIAYIPGAYRLASNVADRFVASKVWLAQDIHFSIEYPASAYGRNRFPAWVKNGADSGAAVTVFHSG